MSSATLLEKLEKVITHSQKALLFNEEYHYFTLNGKRAVGTTNLIQRVYSSEYMIVLKKKIDLKPYAILGKAVHKAIEDFLDGNEYDTKYQKNIHDAMLVLKINQIEEFFTECPLYSADYIAGIADLIGIDKEGTIWVVDWKTSSKPLWEHEIQNEIYRIMLSDLFVSIYGESPKIKGMCVYTPRDHNKGKLKYVETDTISEETKDLLRIHRTKMKKYGTYYDL